MFASKNLIYSGGVMLKESAFGKNDIRGIYGDDITEELFYYTGNWLSSSYWLRSFGIGHGSDQLMGHIIDYEGKLESAVSTKYNGVHPMIYIR